MEFFITKKGEQRGGTGVVLRGSPFIAEWGLAGASCPKSVSSRDVLSVDYGALMPALVVLVPPLESSTCSMKIHEREGVVSYWVNLSPEPNRSPN